MQVILETIEFNHDQTSATHDAFNIRCNETELVEIPEWRQGKSIRPEDSVAAYARDELNGRSPSIKAKLRIVDIDPGIKSLKVRALDGHLSVAKRESDISNFALRLMRFVFPDALATNVLGRVEEREISLDNPEELVSFNLADVRINDVGVSASDIIWRWQFRTDDTDWTDFETTNHRIFTVLALPTLPWLRDSPNRSNPHVPWSEVLEFACRWASGAQDVEAAATLITQKLNALGVGGVILAYSKDPTYIPEGSDNFDCTKFLERLNGGASLGKYVSCYECATVVSSFSNILGAALWQGVIGTNFVVNHVVRIGEAVPLPDDFFDHEVAWTGEAEPDDPLFDACIHLDGDLKPGKNPFVPLLAANMPFGNGSDGEYKSKLKADTRFGGPCDALSESKHHRDIGVGKLKKRVLSFSQLQVLEKHYGFEAWKNPEPSSESILFWQFFYSTPAIPNWRPRFVRTFESMPDMPVTTEAFWSKETDSRGLVRLVVHECASAKAARLTLLELLGGFHVLDMQRQQFNQFSGGSRMAGEVVFLDPKPRSLLFTRGNVVMSLRNEGATEMDVEEFAKALEVWLSDDPNSLNASISRMDHFNVDTGQVRVGEVIPLELGHCSSQQKGVMYRFFAPKANLFIQNSHPVFKAAKPGSYRLDVFANSKDRSVRMQTLQLNVL